MAYWINVLQPFGNKIQIFILKLIFCVNHRQQQKEYKEFS